MCAAYWLAALVAPPLLFDATHISVAGILYLATAAGVVTLGAVTATSRTPTRSAAVTAPAARPRILVAVVAAGSASALAASAVHIYINGFDLADVLTVGGLLDIGSTVSEVRYHQQRRPPVAVPILLATTYTAALVAPFMRLTATRRAWRYLPVAAATFYSGITTERLAFLLCATFTAGSTLAVSTLIGGAPPLVTRRAVAKTFAATAAVAVAFTAIAVIRAGDVDQRSLTAVRAKLGVYAFGYEPAFAGWVDHYRRHPEPLRYGAATSAIVGWADRDRRGRYGDFMQVSAVGQRTNIYTGLRGLLLDFGHPGAVVALFGFGALFGMAHRRVVVHGSPVAAVVVGCCCAVLLLSPVQSIVMFSNVCGAMASAAAVAWLVHRPRLKVGGDLHHARRPVAPGTRRVAVDGRPTTAAATAVQAAVGAGLGRT